MRTPRRLALPRLILCVWLMLIVLAGLPHEVQAKPFGAEDSVQGVEWSAADTVVEHLRLKVPAEARRTWLELELQIWDPWLRKQPGFLGRELLWDPQAEEGFLLIRWASRADWHAIPTKEIEAVQARFEQQTRRALAPGDVPGQFRHPFPLLHAGELQPLLSSSMGPEPAQP